MTAISKSWVTIADSAVDPDSPLDAQLLTGMRDDLVHLREWLGASFVGGAVQDHNHDGLNSALLPVGPNLLRNGSFEDGTAGWTVTQYTGGTVVIDTSNPLHGEKCLKFVSTVLANGGGDAVSNEYLPVSGDDACSLFGVIKAAAANLSFKAEILWYNSAKSLISTTTVYTSNNVPTALTNIGSLAVAPNTARWMRCKITGHIAGSSAPVTTGTIYADGFVARTAERSSVFEAPGTYTFVMPRGRVFVRAQAAGGSQYASYPGAGGGYVEGWVYASVGTSVTVTVGAGVLSAAGGSSSFGSYLSCTGGGRGVSTGAIGGTATPTTQVFASAGQNGAGTTYVNGANAGLALNSGGIYNTAGQSADGKYGGGGSEVGASSGTGKGGDGYVSVEWE